MLRVSGASSVSCCRFQLVRFQKVSLDWFPWIIVFKFCFVFFSVLRLRTTDSLVFCSFIKDCVYYPFAFGSFHSHCDIFDQGKIGISISSVQLCIEQTISFKVNLQDTQAIYCNNTCFPGNQTHDLNFFYCHCYCQTLQGKQTEEHSLHFWLHKKLLPRNNVFFYYFCHTCNGDTQKNWSGFEEFMWV